MVDWLGCSLFDRFEEGLCSKEFLAENEITGLLFSASWCKPCRQFEKTLSLLHKYIQSGDSMSFGILIVSDDKYEDEYEKHVTELPWPAIPFNALKLKAKLKRQYHVTALPKLVILESRSGKVLNHDAKNDVEVDLKGIKFPWIEPSVLDLLRGKFIFSGNPVTVDKELINTKYLGILFSAEWCPPCRNVLPIISSLHSSLKENGFEIVYCSFDKDKEKHEKSILEMPWYVFPWNDVRIKQLIKILQIEDIPQLVIWNCHSNSVVNKNAIPRIKVDLLGKEYPWVPENLTLLSMENIEEMSRTAAFLYIAESESDLKENSPKIRETADLYREQFRFYIVSDEDHVVARLRDILQLGDQCPYLLFLDFETKVMARCENKKPSGADLLSFVEAVKSGSVDFTDFPPYD